jgi:hypothetical protein
MLPPLVDWSQFRPISPKQRKSTAPMAKLLDGHLHLHSQRVALSAAIYNNRILRYVRSHLHDRQWRSWGIDGKRFNQIRDTTFLVGTGRASALADLNVFVVIVIGRIQFRAIQLRKEAG